MLNRTNVIRFVKSSWDSLYDRLKISPTGRRIQAIKKKPPVHTYIVSFKSVFIFIQCY